MIRRLSDKKHIPQIVAFGKKWHKKTAHAAIPFSTDRSTKTVHGAMMSLDHIVLAAYDQKQLVGILIGALCTYPFFEGTYATDLVFIAEKHGMQLFREFSKWAARHKCNSLQMGVTSGLPNAERFYEGLDMRRVGGIYLDLAEENT